MAGRRGARLFAEALIYRAGRLLNLIEARVAVGQRLVVLDAGGLLALPTLLVMPVFLVLSVLIFLLGFPGLALFPLAMLVGPGHYVVCMDYSRCLVRCVGVWIRWAEKKKMDREEGTIQQQFSPLWSPLAPVAEV